MVKCPKCNADMQYDDSWLEVHPKKEGLAEITGTSTYCCRTCETKVIVSHKQLVTLG